MAFISVYIPSFTGTSYFFIAVLFHFASECTISAFLFKNGTVNETGVSTQFKLSLVPVSGRTNSGDDTLSRFNSLASSFWKKSFNSFIAFCVSKTPISHL